MMLPCVKKMALIYLKTKDTIKVIDVMENIVQEDNVSYNVDNGSWVLESFGLVIGWNEVVFAINLKDGSVTEETFCFINSAYENMEKTNVGLSDTDGDGINDYFKIYNLESYPDNELVVLDRRGKIVYRCKNYQNDWSAEGIPDGVYYFRLLIKHPSNSKINQGTLTIIR
jgi:gliding motility-associated-like protein